jgi:hypothetical protein
VRLQRPRRRRKRSRRRTARDGDAILAVERDAVSDVDLVASEYARPFERVAADRELRDRDVGALICGLIRARGPRVVGTLSDAGHHGTTLRVERDCVQ